MAFQLPVIVVEFDDGRVERVQTRQSDVVLLEEQTQTSLGKQDFASISFLMRLAHIAAKRLKLAGIADDFHEFIDTCNVEWGEVEAGKASDPAPPTG